MKHLPFLCILSIFGACSNVETPTNILSRSEFQTILTEGQACSTPGSQKQCALPNICSPITGNCQRTCISDAECNSRYLTAGNTCVNPGSEGYCEQACSQTADCDTGFSCNNSICNKTCVNNIGCLGGQQCSVNGFCTYPTCTGDANCTSPGFTKCSSNGFCVPDPDPCGNTICGANEHCKNSACMCGLNPACTDGQTCSASGQCQCGNNGSGCNSGETCTGSGDAAQCKCGSGPSCGTGNPCLSGACKCAGVSCALGDTCSSSGQCIKPFLCGGVECGGACIDSMCLANGGDGTCGTACAAGQACFSGQCLNACGNTANYCLGSETCTKGSCSCGSNGSCGASSICANGNCIAKGCGDGYKTGSEVCDEGQISASTPKNCPNSWSYSSVKSSCIPNNEGAGNGNNGHCATDCQTQCVLPANDNTPYWPASGLGTALAKLKTIAVSGSSLSCSPTELCPVGQSCSPTSSSCQINSWSDSPKVTPTQCPNGLGIWVKYSEGSFTAVTSAFTVTNSVGIYGGFAGTEASIYDRVDPKLTAQTPLGLQGTSGTIFSGSTSAFVFAQPAGSQATLDGFQVLNCNGGAIVINSDATVNLRNLYISRNTSQDGGGIKNSGVMNLKHSILTMNTATEQGGGISHVSAAGSPSTIENVIFFGNGISITSPLPPICTSGGTCRFGMTCPTGGGLCTGTPAQPTTCISSSDCLPNTTCSAKNVCTGTFSPWQSTSGGAIAIANTTPAAQLNIYASKFNSNYAYSNGGGVYTTMPVNIISSIFTGNWASNAGGGVWLGASNSTLGNLTFRKNAAYNQGGGAIYDGGSNNIIANSLFRDNTGLYPVNSNSSDAPLLEWAGNRAPLNPVGTINANAQYSSANMFAPFNSEKYTFLDICPTIAYENNTGTSGNSPQGLCSGGELCGTPIMATIGSITFNTNAVGDSSGALNFCAASREFVDCEEPAFLSCTPFSNMGIPGNSVAASSFTYQRDFAGVEFPPKPFLGAYQTLVPHLPGGFNCCSPTSTIAFPNYCAIPDPAHSGQCSKNTSNPAWTNQIPCANQPSTGVCTY